MFTLPEGWKSRAFLKRVFLHIGHKLTARSKNLALARPSDGAAAAMDVVETRAFV